MKFISIAEVEYLAHKLAQKIIDWKQLLPDFESRPSGVLENCLEVSFRVCDKKSLYKGLVGKAAALFYVMIKNHPFQNGNKRIAITTTLVFFFKNNHWLSVENQELYNFARWVAESNPKLKREVIGAIEKFMRLCLVKAAA
jgi:death-on-curing family protein